MSDSDVFIISAIRAAEPVEAIRQAVKSAGVNPSRVQDVVFGLDGSLVNPNAGEIVSKSGLACPSVIVSSSLRAVFFAAQSILSGDVELAVVIGMDGDSSTAMLLASPDSVGRWNLVPRARLAARSLTGVESVLRAAELSSEDVSTFKDGKNGARLVMEALEELEEKPARWGVVSMNSLVLLIERI